MVLAILHARSATLSLMLSRHHNVGKSNGPRLLPLLLALALVFMNTVSQSHAGAHVCDHGDAQAAAIASTCGTPVDCQDTHADHDDAEAAGEEVPSSPCKCPCHAPVVASIQPVQGLSSELGVARYVPLSEHSPIEGPAANIEQPPKL